MALKRCIDKECITTWALGDHCPKCGLAADGSNIEPLPSVASETKPQNEMSDSEMLRKITKHSETIPLSASPNGPELDTSEMSNTELLRRMEFNTRKTSAWTVKIYWLIFIAILVGPLIQQTVIGILVSIGLANQ